MQHPFREIPRIRGTRGISPLVATVLLLAFAVAIGTMIMSYIINNAVKSPCQKVELSLEGDDAACYKDGSISFLLANNGQQRVSGLLLRIVNQNKDITEVKSATELDPPGGTQSTARIDTTYQTFDPAAITIKIIPAITDAGAEAYCSEAEYKLRVKPC